jgi:RES domain-containing protein
MGCGRLMLLWRLSGTRYASDFAGGYGLLFDGRWNTIGHAVTYCATSPSLCILEKLVHVEDPALLPDLTMVTYDVPDDLGVETVTLAQLPEKWQSREGLSQNIGDEWVHAGAKPLLCVPSAILALPASPDVNFLISHNHPGAAEIRILNLYKFVFDPRLL